MAYTSKYTGKQMEAVFKKVSNIVTGTISKTCPVDGLCHFSIPNVSGKKNMNYKSFVNVKTSIMTPNQYISVSSIYTASGDTLTIYISGSGVVKGEEYTAEYMLIE